MTLPILVCVSLLPLYGDSQADVLDVVASMAAALTAVNVPEFMDAIDKDMPGFDTLRDQVTALVNQAEVTSSIEPIRNEGDDARRTLDLDWYLEVRSLLQDGPIVRRREVIHCELRKQKKKWKVVSLKPLDFFAPAKLGQ
ncbi:MAG: hypothetical protein LAP38_02445 [Acidobacteriia bacterium]|nr:hypothetical protein [Terriglobia bacterium]